MPRPDWITGDIDSLLSELLKCKTKPQLAAFLRDVATIGELTEMSSRWRAAQLLHAGHPYRAVAAETGLSTTTVSRVAYWIQHGEGGYRAALARLSRK